MQNKLKTGYCGEGRRELKMEKHTCKNGKHQKRYFIIYFFSKQNFEQITCSISCMQDMYVYMCMYVCVGYVCSHKSKHGSLTTRFHKEIMDFLKRKRRQYLRVPQRDAALAHEFFRAGPHVLSCKALHPKYSLLSQCTLTMAQCGSSQATEVSPKLPTKSLPLLFPPTVYFIYGQMRECLGY